MSTTTDKDRESGKKLTIDALVEIGDALHDSEASFMLILEPTLGDNLKRKITYATHGERSDIIQMFVRVLDKNPDLYEILTAAMIKAKVKQIIEE